MKEGALRQFPYMLLNEIESKQIPKDILETDFSFVSSYLEVKDERNPELSKDKR